MQHPSLQHHLEPQPQIQRYAGITIADWSKLRRTLGQRTVQYTPVNYLFNDTGPDHGIRPDWRPRLPWNMRVVKVRRVELTQLMRSLATTRCRRLTPYTFAPRGRVYETLRRRSSQCVNKRLLLQPRLVPR